MGLRKEGRPSYVCSIVQIKAPCNYYFNSQGFSSPSSVSTETRLSNSKTAFFHHICLLLSSVFLFKGRYLAWRSLNKLTLERTMKSPLFAERQIANHPKSKFCHLLKLMSIQNHMIYFLLYNTKVF